MASFVAEFQKRTIIIQGNLAVFHYLELHPGAPQDKLPATVNWHSAVGPCHPNPQIKVSANSPNPLPSTQTSSRPTATNIRVPTQYFL